MGEQDIQSAVQTKYGSIARQVLDAGQRTTCCGGGSALPVVDDFVARNLYAAQETASLPPAAVLASLGCGNPTALAALRPGEVVLDLGSGGGIDVLLSARRVGPPRPPPRLPFPP